MPLPVPQTWLCVVALAGAPARAESVSEKRMELLFRPPVAEQIALSPDSEYVAYTEHAGGELRIVVFDLARQRRAARILADEDRPLLHSKEKERAQLRFLAWANRHRLVFAPTIETAALGRHGQRDAAVAVLSAAFLLVREDATRRQFADAYAKLTKPR